MFKKINRREIQICSLLLFLALSFIFHYNVALIDEKLGGSTSELVKSSYYSVSPIYIEGDNPSRDWAYFKSHYPWCTGSGTKNDPYIIDNIFIDASGVGSCIRILRSEDYFIIQNCLLNNSLYGFDIDYTDNGRIQNNTLSYHSQLGIEMHSTDNFTIDNNIFINNYRGIHVYSYCRNINITNNIVSNCGGYGIYLGGVYNSIISKNLISNNGNEGIDLYDCEGNILSDNILENNGNEGIILEGFTDESIDNIFFNNTASLNGVGMSIGGRNNLVMNNTLYSNAEGLQIGGIGNTLLENSLHDNTQGLSVFGSANNISYNNVSINTDQGIQIYCSNSFFYNNIVKDNNDGIHLTGNMNHIEANEISMNLRNGVLMENADNNTINQNLIEHNGLFGLHLDGNPDTPSYYNIISENMISANDNDGISIWECSLNSFLGNTIANHVTSNGIYTTNVEDSIFKENIFYNNINGIEADLSYDNIFERNNFTDNIDNGVYLAAFCVRNNFSENIFMYNGFAGLNIDRDYRHYAPDAYTNLNNHIYNNSFIGNLVNAFVNSTRDFWNSSTVGNFWDDFLIGVDANDDGISEIPYLVNDYPLVPAVYDYLPIYDDGDDPAPPIISITSPTENQMTGINPPDFQISITGLHVNTTWYELVDGSTNYTFSGSSGTINQELWEEFGNGTVTLRFYVNDTLGYGTSDEITVRKDIYQPQLTINTPIDNSLYESIAPTFNVEISDPNLDSSWYSLDGGLTKIFFTTNSSINQTIWDTMPDGQFEIIFYVNDTAGNLIFDSRIIRKDTNSPIITIISPIQSSLFGNSTIDFNVEIFDLNLETMWYTIIGSLINITFTSNGTIDSALWNSYGSGDLTIIFYANDTHGRISMESIVISKDSDPPNISIITPSAGESFYVTPPDFEISVNDPNLFLVWYTIDGGITNINITEYTGFIDSSIWASAPIGDITIRFYAKDTLGNTVFKEVVISKKSVSEPQPEPMIPGYNLFILIGILSIAIYAIIRRYRLYH